MNAFDREAIRQQRETFELKTGQDRLWFNLRLTIGYAAVVLLLGVLVVCAVVLLRTGRYPEFVVKAASATLLADVGLLAPICKFVLNASR